MPNSTNANAPLAEGHVSILHRLVQDEHAAVEAVTAMIPSFKNVGRRQTLIRMRDDMARHVDALVSALAANDAAPPARTPAPSGGSPDPAPMDERGVMRDIYRAARRRRGQYARLAAQAAHLPDALTRLIAEGSETTARHYAWVEEQIAQLGPGRRDRIAKQVGDAVDDVRARVGPRLRALRPETLPPRRVFAVAATSMLVALAATVAIDRRLRRG